MIFPVLIDVPCYEAFPRSPLQYCRYYQAFLDKVVKEAQRLSAIQ